MEVIERPETREPQPEKRDHPCTAETAECTCPDFCERDHANE
jgi:hypothetical protein